MKSVEHKSGSKLLGGFGNLGGFSTQWHPSKVVDSCFGNGTKWISRNQYLAIVSGNPFHSIPETTVHYFYRDMKGAQPIGKFIVNLKRYLYPLLLICSLAAQSQPLTEAKQAFHQGNYEQAMLHWQTVLNANPTSKVRQEAILNIARIYRYLGIYAKALTTLNTAIAQAGDDKAYKALLINELSKLRMSQGDKGIEPAIKHGEQALAMARAANNPLVLAKVLNHWGNLLTTEYDYEEAQKAYSEALEVLAKPVANSSFQETTTGEIKALRGKILINQAKTLYFLDVDGAHQYTDASQAFKGSIAALQSALQTTQNWPDVYSQVLGLINISQVAQKIQQRFTQPSAQLTAIAYQALTTARTVAERLNHPTAKAYASGFLGQLYERAKRYDEALTLTRQAQFFTQQAREKLFVSYLWQWQIGRILKAKGDNLKAITAYQNAIENFQPVRSEMTSTGYFNIWEQTFRESAAPIYFELADLLLQQARNTSVATKREKLLQQARTVIEQFKEAELQDYFQSDCIDTHNECGDLAKILDGQTAILYPIPLPDRLELLLQKRDSLVQATVFTPEKTLRSKITSFLSPLRHHPNLDELERSRGLRAAAGKEANEELCTPSLRGSKPQSVTKAARTFAEPAQKLYDWLIKPLHSHLQGIETLVIAPDGALRTIPFSALHDGKQFLIQKYALAVTPSLCFSEQSMSSKETKQILLAGLSEAVQGFSSLPCAKYELESLHTLFSKMSNPLLNKDFITEKVSTDIKQTEYSIVHIASHGQFSANLKNTFVLTYDDKLSMDQLERLMGLATVKERPVDMLTLSACETAVGDDRAALGLAGVALKAGVKTALASLWKVDDEATPAVVIEFYQQLRNSISKAKALQKAQIMMLTDKNYVRYQHPYYWSAFLLIGNWL